MNSKHPPAQQLLPRPGPPQVPASHATSGRAGRCAAPWRPAPRRPRRPARYLAAGGRSRNERGGLSVVVARAVSARPDREPRPGVAGPPKGQPQRHRPVQCRFPATFPQCRRPASSLPCILEPARHSSLDLVQPLRSLCKSPCKHNCGYTRQGLRNLHCIIDTRFTPNRSMAQACCSEERQ